MSDYIKYEAMGGVGKITFNRPDKYNAFTREMAFALQEALDQCAENQDVRCVYLVGAGKAFSAGQDLAEVADAKGPGMNRILSEHYNPIVTRIRKMDKPIVAAVNGVAAGAGANIALACDIVVASEEASFIQAFSAIGLIPDSSGTYTLPRLVGSQRAKALMMLGDRVNAKEAERIGMIYQYYPAHEFEAKSWELAVRLSTMATKALAYTKLALRWSDTHTFSEQLENEDKLQRRAASTSDFKEGLNAFMEKRKPNFEGR